VTVAIRGDTLGRPNGIALDAVGKRFVIVEFGGRSVLAWKPGDKAPSVIAKGPGGFDGVEIVGAGSSSRAGVIRPYRAMKPARK